jgi:tRNA G10  N-methylase Trm11
MVLCILGRQPKLGLAELERLYGADALTPISEGAVLVDILLETILARPLGSTMKIAEVLKSFDTTNWQKVSQHTMRLFEKALPYSGKVTIGLSAYGFAISPREVQKTGITLKQRLKNRNGSIRVIPQTEVALNTAQVLHNKLGTADNKKEIIFVKTDAGQTIIAETRHVQDIEAYTFRDLGRPMRDAFVGMLPPKLAQTMINLSDALEFAPSATTPFSIPAAGKKMPSLLGPKGSREYSGGGVDREHSSAAPRLLDPFCGTGVLLQEAALMGYAVYGTDSSEKMIRYSRDNINWLTQTHHLSFDWYLHAADARTETWQQPIDVVVCETYLGQPFSSEPDPEKLEKTRRECNAIVKEFLQNLAPQLASGTPLCIAVPAWHTKSDVHHLPLLDDLVKIGYNRIDFTHASSEELVYHREDQIVGRELLVLTRS